MEKTKKALVLYSGGLDSRLVIRMLLDQDFHVTALYFALPFGCGCCNLNCNFNFAQKEQVKMEIIDVNKEPLLSEYLELIKNPIFGTGAGINPCKDCKIYIFKYAKQYAKDNNIDVIATGEVIGQRPMSQIPSAMKIIDTALDFEILRPLCAKLMPETKAEKDGLVDRSKLLDISGRGRKIQMQMAEDFGIQYPTPGGGCFLCEKASSKRLDNLLEHNLITEKSLPLTMLGRHFYIDGVWFVVARNGLESGVIAKYETHIPDAAGKPTVYYSKEEGKQKSLELQEVYSTGKSEEERNKFAEFKL